MGGGKGLQINQRANFLSFSPVIKENDIVINNFMLRQDFWL